MSIILLFKSKQNVLYCRRLLFVFLLLVTSKAFYSQSLSKENASLHIEENTVFFVKEEDSVKISKTPVSTIEAEKGDVYIASDTHIYGINHVENFKLHKTQTFRNKTEEDLVKLAYAYKGKKTIESKVVPVVFIKSHDSHLFWLWTGTTGYVVINNTTTYKFYFLSKDNFSYVLRPYYVGNVQNFFDFNFSLRKVETPNFYTRPPPFYSIFSYAV